MRTNNLSKDIDAELETKKPRDPKLETLRKDGYYDQALQTHIVSVTAGDFRWTGHDNLAFSTVLGSCLSVCAYDEHIGIGGMNHFLLPEAPEKENGEFSQSFRYGSAALESLLNSLYRKGAAKNGLKIKIFGGGKVLNGVSKNIGKKNIDFARKYFMLENLRIDSEDIGGSQGRYIVFFPKTGKVLLKILGEDSKIAQIAKEEQNILKTLKTQEIESDVELF